MSFITDPLTVWNGSNLSSPPAASIYGNFETCHFTQDFARLRILWEFAEWLWLQDQKNARLKYFCSSLDSGSEVPLRGWWTMGPRNSMKRQALPRFMSSQVGIAEVPPCQREACLLLCCSRRTGIFRFLCDTWYLQNHSLTETPSGHPWLQPRVDNSNQRAEHPHNNNGTICLDQEASQIA